MNKNKGFGVIELILCIAVITAVLMILFWR